MKAMDSSIALQQIIRGDIVNGPATARKIAEALILDLYGAEELLRQEPLQIRARDNGW